NEVHWTYLTVKDTTSGSAGPYHVWTKAPDGTCTEQLLNDQYNHPGTTFGFGLSLVGKPYEALNYASCTLGSPVTKGTLLRRSMTEYTQTNGLTIGGFSPVYQSFRDVRPDKEVSMIFETGSTSALISKSETTYDTSGNSDPTYFSSLNANQI